LSEEDFYITGMMEDLEKNRYSKSSTFDYPLSNDYMWCKMILESFKDEASINDPNGYFSNQYSIRSDVFEAVYFFRVCREHVISLKKAFEDIINNNSDLPSFPNSLAEQIYKCDYVFDFDKSIEFAVFSEKKIALITSDNFENVIQVMEHIITEIEGASEGLDLKNNLKNDVIKSFKYKKINTSLSNLTDLMNALKTEGFIDDSLSLSSFRKVFSGVVVDEKIVWKGRVSELSYFIKQLHNELKYVENLKQQQWLVTVNCFVNKSHELFDREQLKGQKKPAASKTIDKVLNTLK
jgi:hypothetical protein